MTEIRLDKHHAKDRRCKILPQPVASSTRFKDLFESHRDIGRAVGILLVSLIAGIAADRLLNTALPEAKASDFSLRTETTPLAVTVPVDSTTLIRINNDRIRSAIFDKTLMDIQTDRDAGCVYVLPKVETTSIVYLTAQSGETAAVRLTFAKEAPARTIVLERNEKAESLPVFVRDPVEHLKPLQSEGFSADVKRLVTLSLRDDRTGGEILLSSRKTAGPAAGEALRKLVPLKAKFSAVYRSTDMEATKVIVKNGGIRPVALDPRALSVAGIYAVALTRQTLAPGEYAELVLVEADRGEH